MKKHVEEMRPKEVHCVCPFLKEKSIKRAEFLRLSNSGYFEERGVNFEGISDDKLVDFLIHTCKNRLYKVDEFPIESGKILYLAGDALGEKAYYLLTAVVKEYEGLTQVLLRANSDKNYGLDGFLNEILDNLRHLVQSTSAREIGIIKKEQVINIIDSVVQRTTFATGEGASSVNIRGSVVQRVEIKGDEERKRREEDRIRKEREEQERTAKEGEELTRKEPEGTSWKSFFAVALVLGILLLGYMAFAPGATEAPGTTKPTPTPQATTGVTPKVTQIVSPALASTPAPDQKNFTNSIAATTPAPQTATPVPSASVELHGEKTDVGIGEDIILRLSSVNLITKPVMTVQVILIPPSGMSVTSLEFVTSGAGQYTTTYKLEPGGRKDIEIRIQTNQIGDFKVNGRVVYYYGDNKSTAEDYTVELPIKVRSAKRTGG